MTFQALDYKENNILDLTDDNDSYTKPTYIKSNIWLKYFEYSNTLCM